MDLIKTVNKITQKKALILLLMVVLVYDLFVWKRNIKKENCKKFPNFSKYKIFNQKNTSNPLPLDPISESSIDLEILKYLCDPLSVRNHSKSSDLILKCPETLKLLQSEWTNSQLLQYLPNNGNPRKIKAKITYKDLSSKYVTVNDFGDDGSNRLFRHKKTLLRLLKMQNWKETPRLIAVCCLNRFQKDFCSGKKKKIFFIRSVVETFEEETPLCASRDYDQDCFSLTTLQNHLKTQSHLRVAALTFLTNLASIFNRFQTQGLLPLKFNPKDIRFTKDLEVKIAAVDDFYQLDEVSGGIFQRYFGHVTCPASSFCNFPEIAKREEIFHHFGTHCNEITGHCDPFTSRCYGITSHSYLCIFSKWIIESLLALIARHDDHQLQAVIICSQQSDPSKRCGWKDVERVFSSQLTLASRHHN